MIIGNTNMSTVKVAISIERRLLGRLDALVKRRAFSSRSKAIQQAVEEKLDRLDRSRLARECAKLDARSERALADEGLAEDFAEWPEY
jgi:Arc/MetJ-type ribon-helix-helix transcriptional regulator